jgi:uncharacterized protein YeaO (DUF488 family)
MIQVKRVYEATAKSDGKRFLIDRVWPRGVTKESLHMAAWLKEVAPSNDLRKWFSHDPAKWKEFQKRYHSQLDRQPETWQPLRESAGGGNITLLFSARDTEHNNAVALRDYLKRRLKTGTGQKHLP